jgi:hypothetical protein
MGIDTVEKDRLLILDIISISSQVGSYFNSMSLSQNVGFEHEVCTANDITRQVEKHGIWEGCKANE